jgi:hypothetical protein
LTAAAIISLIHTGDGYGLSTGVLTTVIILLILIIILILPVGADAAYREKLSLKIKIGPFSRELLKKKDGERAKPKKKTEAKAKKKKEKPSKPKKRTSSEEIFGIVRLVLNALNRFRKKLSVAYLRLGITVGSEDPYNAAVAYGGISAAVGSLTELLDRSMNIEEKDISVSADFEAQRIRADARLILVIQIWQILYIVLAFGYGYFRLRLQKRREERKNKNGTK